jgi:hypothetical protein
MRFIAVLAAAAILMPVTLAATQAGVSTELSAAAKKKKSPAKPKEEYLKAAPGTGPSGPKK